MSFGQDLAKFAAKASTNMDVVVRTITLELATAVVERTPVGNPDTWAGPAPEGYVGGRLRANWQFSPGAPLTSRLDTTDHAGVLTKIASAVDASAAGGITWLSNNLPYAVPIEFEGHSKQAPAGMVRVSVAEAQQYVNRAMAALR
jgi:hypothetical protein